MSHYCNEIDKKRSIQTIEYWKDSENQCQFIEGMAKQLRITSMDQWYYVEKADIVERGGNLLINEVYRGSLIEAIKGVYPHHDWKVWQFKQVPKVREISILRNN